ncbi:MAG: DUF502 domain-containing protein [Planctomycetaceae bacterium]|nr:DUF502 domain-containing protein [Planctomycetaceae bacterium]
MSDNVQGRPTRGQPVSRPFRRAVLRGLAVLCPPLLTVLILVWAINTTKSYFLEPVTGWARQAIVWGIKDTREGLRLDSPAGRTATVDGRQYHQLDNGTFIPEEVFQVVERKSEEPLPTSGDGFYRRYVDLRYLRPYYTIPFFLSVFILFLYFLGKFMAAGIGGFFTDLFERFVARVPGVRAVYSSIKQVTDFLFGRQDVRFTHIVAVEFPRKGIWSMGFVTSEHFATIADAAGEPVFTVLIPYSPIPHSGCTITVRRADCIELDITFDQACQFIFSCGVVVPPEQAGLLQKAERTDVKQDAEDDPHSSAGVR